jgi:ribosomal protein S18 acetylase RimI-like enzyme
MARPGSRDETGSSDTQSAMPDDPKVRLATEQDADVLARLLREFNDIYNEETPPHDALMRRIPEHISAGTSYFLLAGDGPDGFAQVTIQPTLYSDVGEAYLFELYVREEKRRQGLGRALLEAAMEEARSRGMDHMSLTTSMGDDAARALYEDIGFTNKEGSPDGPLMIYYERDL